MTNVVIASAARTAVGSFSGSFGNTPAHDLGTTVLEALVSRAQVDKSEVSETIMGQVLTAGQGQNPARQALINSGIPVSKPAHIINQVCGSGLRSVVSGYQSIKLGENKTVIVGGQENMTRATHAIYYREDKKFSEKKLVDTMIKDGLLDSFNDYHMGVTAENVAEKYKISRDEQDNFSLNSQKKTEKAYSENKFQDELIKLQIEDGDKKFIFEKDEHPRENLSIDDLKKLKTVFKENGTVTPGNSSGINDGAAALVLMSREQAEKKSLESLVKIVSWATCGVEPSLMGLGPIPSIQEALYKANWKIDEVDLFEINEAFAAQSIAVIKELKIPEQKVNVNGGAIALGHPIGASGARILVTLLHEMKKRDPVSYTHLTLPTICSV